MTNQEKIIKELEKLNLLERRLMIADKLLNLRNDDETKLFKKEWIMKKILKLSNEDIEANN